jgi:hypothetical protein
MDVEAAAGLPFGDRWERINTRVHTMSQVERMATNPAPPEQ